MDAVVVFDFGEVDGADVAGAEAREEAEVGEGERREGFHGGPPGVGGEREGGLGVVVGGGGGGPCGGSGFGGGGGAAWCGGCSGGVEAHGLEIVG